MSGSSSTCPVGSRALVLAALLAIGCVPVREARILPRPQDAALGPLDDCAAWDDPRLHAALDKRTHSREHQGNHAELLVNGDVAFTRRFENAHDADVVLVKTFIFSDDEIGRSTAELLMARARAGAFVVVQYDLRGSVMELDDIGEMMETSSVSGLFGEKRIFREMAEAGVMVVPTNALISPDELAVYGAWLDGEKPSGLASRIWQFFDLLDHMDHEKYWITGVRTADGGLELRAILGGMNIASEYAYGGTVAVDAGTGRGGWRDTDVELRGPVVNPIVDRFFDSLEYHLGAPLEAGLRERLNPPQPEVANARVRFVWNQPRARNHRSIEHLYRQLISATPPGQVVRLEAAYFAPGARVGRRLRVALCKDTRLAVITNSKDSVDAPFIVDASHFEFRRLLRIRPSAALFEWENDVAEGLGTLHSKVASFGTCGPVIVGSANLDAQSSEHNSESVVMIRDPQVRTAFDRMFGEDLSPERVDRITRAELERQGLLQRLKQFVVCRLGWYWL